MERRFYQLSAISNSLTLINLCIFLKRFFAYLLRFKPQLGNHGADCLGDGCTRLKRWGRSETMASRLIAVRLVKLPRHSGAGGNDEIVTWIPA